MDLKLGDKIRLRKLEKVANSIHGKDNYEIGFYLNEEEKQKIYPNIEELIANNPEEEIGGAAFFKKGIVNTKATPYANYAVTGINLNLSSYHSNSKETEPLNKERTINKEEDLEF